MAYKLIFFGTSEFAVPLLQRLAQDARFTIVLVVTQPDRPVGRKQIMTAPAVKVAAQALGLPTFQPERMKAPETLDVLKTYPFDAAVVASYGQILPQTVLDLAPDRFINLHGSLLPAYRGASPITEAIKQGDSETGVTVMIMDAAMDHGPMLHKERVCIEATDTTERLSQKLAERGAETFGDVLNGYLSGAIQAIEQAHSEATLCRLIKKEDARLFPEQQTATELERLVRAFIPWPVAFISLAERLVKVLEARVSNVPCTSTPGTIWLESEHLFLACAQQTTLELISVRPEGGKTMPGAAFFRGIQ